MFFECKKKSHGGPTVFINLALVTEIYPEAHAVYFNSDEYSLTVEDQDMTRLLNLLRATDNLPKTGE